MTIKRAKTAILVVSEHGYGKRSELDEYRVSHRSGKGVFTMKSTEKTGTMVSIREVLDNDDVVVVTARGVVIRQPAKEIREAGRNTQGVRLIRLDEGDKIAAIAVVPTEEEKEDADTPTPTPAVVEAPAGKKEKKTKSQPTLFDESTNEGKGKKASKSGKTKKGKKK